MNKLEAIIKVIDNAIKLKNNGLRVEDEEMKLLQQMLFQAYNEQYARPTKQSGGTVNEPTQPNQKG